MMPGVPSLVFLAYLLGILPGGALRSGRRVGQLLGDAPGRGSARDRLAVWTSTLVAQAILLLLAVVAGRSFGFRFFGFAARPIDWAAAAAALAACFALRAVARAIRSEEERRSLLVYRLAPQTRIEWILWGCVALLASVTEEIAYRGVGVAILHVWTGSLAAAVVVCAVAFAVAHALQGWKSGVVILVMAFLFHALVLFTGTLVPAMLVHLVYDVVAAVAIAREARVTSPAAGSSASSRPVPPPSAAP